MGIVYVENDYPTSFARSYVVKRSESSCCVLGKIETVVNDAMLVL